MSQPIKYIKVSKIIMSTNKKRFYKTLGTSVIYNSISPPCCKAQSDELMKDNKNDNIQMHCKENTKKWRIIVKKIVIYCIVS